MAKEPTPARGSIYVKPTAWALGVAAVIGVIIVAAEIPERWHYTIVPGTVSGNRATGLTGTFRLDFAGIWPTANAIHSEGIGGACIAFLASDVFLTGPIPQSCTKDEDCASLKDQVDAYYCDREGPGRCWVKPLGMSEQLCNRPVALKESEETPVPKPDKVAPIPPGKVKNTASARIVACINKSGAKPAETGCAKIDGPDRLELMGPISTIP